MEKKFFFPNQGTRGENAGRQGSGSVPSAKGKKKEGKEVSRSKQISIKAHSPTTR